MNDTPEPMPTPWLTIRVYFDQKPSVTLRDKDGKEQTWQAPDHRLEVFEPQGGSVSLESDGFQSAKRKQRRRLR